MFRPNKPVNKAGQPWTTCSPPSPPPSMPSVLGLSGTDVQGFISMHGDSQRPKQDTPEVSWMPRTVSAARRYWNARVDHAGLQLQDVWEQLSPFLLFIFIHLALEWHISKHLSVLVDSCVYYSWGESAWRFRNSVSDASFILTNNTSNPGCRV